MARHPQRGIALITALVVVVLLHAVIGAILAGLQTDTGLLFGADAANAADFQARGGIQYALERLASDQGLAWEAAHKVPSDFPFDQIPSNADDAPVEDAEVKVWVQDTDSPTIKTVRAASLSRGDWHFAGLSAVRRETTPGRAYGIELNLGGVPDSVYRLSGRSGAWELLPAPPEILWGPGPPQALPQATNLLAFPEADNHGSLYLVSPKPGEHTLYRYDSETDRWGVLPKLNTLDFYGLATGGERAYASTAAGIFVLDNPKEATYFLDGSPQASLDWNLIERPPASIRLRSGELLVAENMTVRTLGIDADASGNLYARLGGFGGHKLARYDATGASWSFLPDPPAVTYRPVGNGQFAQVDYPQPPKAFSEPAVDDQGNLFIAWRPPNNALSPDSVFKFVPTGGVDGDFANGSWKLLPPAPLKLHDASGQLINLDDLMARDVGGLSVDSEGHLLLHYRVGGALASGIDTVYSYDTSGGAPLIEETLPAIDQQTWVPTGSGYSSVTSGGKVKALSFVAAGGADRPEKLNYSPVSWF